MAFAKFEGNRFRIDGEIAQNHAILVNLTASIVQKLDPLTCSKCLFMTLHYNMYKPINFRSGLFSELHYTSNVLTFEILNSRFLPNVEMIR